MYRLTKKAAEQRRRTQEHRQRGRDRARMAREVDYPAPLPQHRRTLIVIDRDFGEREFRVELFKTRRIDQYRAVFGDKQFPTALGWSGVLAQLRKALPRVMSERRCG